MKNIWLIFLLIGMLAVSCKKDKTKQQPQISFTVNARSASDAPFTLNPLSNSTGEFSYTSSNSNVATINGNMVTVKSVGTATITLTQAGTDDFEQGTSTASFQVVTPGTYVLGQAITGGIIFYINGTGIHGYMISDVDVAKSMPWSTGSIAATSATGTALGTGATNTDRIVTAIGEGTYAAKACRDYRGGGFTDWYLPSTVEMGFVRLQKNAIGGITDTNYWTSTEVSATPANANFVYMGPGTLNGSTVTFNTYSKLYNYSVRAVRAF